MGSRSEIGQLIDETGRTSQLDEAGSPSFFNMRVSVAFME